MYSKNIDQKTGNRHLTAEVDDDNFSLTRDAFSELHFLKEAPSHSQWLFEAADRRTTMANNDSLNVPLIEDDPGEALLVREALVHSVSAAKDVDASRQVLEIWTVGPDRWRHRRGSFGLVATGQPGGRNF